MKKREYFGTDGVRGPYGGPLVNESFAAQLGYAAGRWAGGAGRVWIGHDTRQSSPSLSQAVARGLTAAGLEPVLLGVVPTPAVARQVLASGDVLGVVITASHNPAADNGIKFFGRGGLKLTDEDELAIEAALSAPLSLPANLSVPTAEGTADYIAAASSLLPPDALKGWRIVLDCANGATYMTSPRVLAGLGAEVITIGVAPDGNNINAGVGSEHPGPLAARVKEEGACVGIAHDGDGDRCVLSDENGGVLDGDEILTILALDALQRGVLPRNELVVTVQSNLGVDTVVQAAGGRVARTSVGDRYVIERMRVSGANLGGESSGHIVCADVSPTGDGLVAALRVLDVMRRTGQPLSQLRAALAKYPQGTRALRVAQKRELEACATLSQEASDLERELGNQGRVLVRFSGTEAKLRLLVEAANQSAVDAALARLEAAARCDLEVV